MSRITREEILEAFSRLGEIAAKKGEELELLLLGGALMAIRYQARDSTKDVDCVIRRPARSAVVREAAVVVAKSEVGLQIGLTMQQRAFWLGNQVSR